MIAFIKRVNANSWRNHIPKHVESMITDPIMVEVVELGIKFMADKIPNAFAVAELLYCPIDKVWTMYSSDNVVHTAIRKRPISVVEEQMRMDWEALMQLVCTYARIAYGGDEDRVVSLRKEMLRYQTQDDVTKAQKTWHALVKHATKDKEMVQLSANAKVLFLKLRTYHNKLKKDATKAGEAAERHSPQSTTASSPVNRGRTCTRKHTPPKVSVNTLRGNTVK